MRAARRNNTNFIKPMLATATDQAFDHKEWIFELKLDGYRAIAEISGKKIKLYSRNAIDLSVQFPSLIPALEKAGMDVILDGEIVLLDEKGKANFQELQNYTGNSSLQLVYFVFDILSLKKNDLKDMALLERKKILKKIIKRSGMIRYCDHIEKRGIDLFNIVQERNGEGIMAKKKDSLYVPGIRTREWLKIKNHKSQEAIIIGYTEPKGSRSHFGSLILAEYEKEKLKYIGHVGTGFNDSTLRILMEKMRPLVMVSSPLDKKIKTNSPATWLRPKLVGEIGFTERTKDGILRHPVFKRLRADKKSKGVKAEAEKILPLKKVLRSLNKQA
ncbi:MAG TPA: non-homologous end-joining DNA ligase [Chitinophagaceae bacterium]|nr:non-homologous end-joining DNA ligase [Chitinophagaceae bacterium]